MEDRVPYQIFHSSRPKRVVRYMINVSMVFMIRQIGVTNLMVGRQGLYTETMPEYFCCRTPDHEFCECYNTAREDGKFCGYANFEDWNGCSKVNAQYKYLKETLPEAYTNLLTENDKKCLAQVCVGDNAAKYLPRQILDDCKDLQICSIDVEVLGTMR